LSEVKPKTGKLTMAATHLGDPQDMPLRSLEALRSADLLVFEEDRPARSFLKAAGVHRDYLKYSEHGQSDTLEQVTRVLKSGGWVTYMSDQGTPGLADPGRELVARAYDLQARVEVIPGPSSMAAIIAAAPFPCHSFTFLGFPPREPPLRLKALRAAAQFDHPVILMDTPYRLAPLLEACKEAFGGARRAVLALEISCPGESFWYGQLDALTKRAGSLTEKVNFVLMVRGKS
jgi:16S rRNA (cytidine1402-2'-O)-methyltransferase